MAYKLLLADDSITVQRVIELTFSREDAQITSVGDGESAMERIAAEPPDIVLADVGMRRGSGYDVAAFVKGRRDLRRIPVLLLTGAFEPLDMERAAKVGYDGVLVKPFEPHQVIARVHEAMRAAEERAASSDEPEPPSPPSVPREEPRDAKTSALDAYFERLDAALDTYAPAPAQPASALREETAPPAPPPLPSPSQPESPALDLPEFPVSPMASTRPAPAVRHVEPEPPPKDRTAADVASILAAAFDTAPPLRSRTEPAVSSPAGFVPPVSPSAAHAPSPVPPPAPPSPRAVADAFSAILAAESGEEHAAPPALGVSLWTPVLTGAFVDEVARRVAERLAPDVARGLVARAVAEAAERVVREEVARVQERARLTSDRA